MARAEHTTLQTAPGTTQPIDAGVDVIAAGKTITDLIRLTSGTIVNVMYLPLVSGVVDATEAGTAGTKAGFLRISAEGTIRYLRLYDAGN